MNLIGGTTIACLVLALAPPTAARVSQEDRGLFSGVRWRELGPAVFSGRIVDIAIRADDPSALLVATATGGLWRSINNGTTWSCIFEREASFSIGDIAWDREDPDIIWVGTGEANNQRSSYWGDGIYKTVDGGKSWRNMGLPKSSHIGRIVVDPENSDVVYVAALGNLYSANEERGLYKTDDGGHTWRRALYVSPEVGVVDVALDPRDANIVYAATYERLRRAWHFDGAGPGSGIWKSTDGGLSWRRLGGGLPEGEIGRIGLDVFAGDPDTLVATVSNQNQTELPPAEDPTIGLAVTFKGRGDDAGFEVRRVADGSGAERIGLRREDLLIRLGDERLDGAWDWLRALASLERDAVVDLVWLRRGERFEARTTRAELERVADPATRKREIGGEVYRSQDAGATWTKINDDPVGGDPDYYYGQIRVDPSDANRIYVLGVPLMGTEDGGKTWRSNFARGVHVDHHALEIDPRDGRRMVLGNDGGLAISYDRGATWDHYGNLPVSQFYDVGLDESRPYRVYGGTQDNGTWGGPSVSRNPVGIGAEEWDRIGGGDGFYAQIDPLDPSTVYGESQFGAIYRRDVRTGTTRSIRPRNASGEEPYRFNWSSPILLSSHNSRIVYFGGNRLFKSYNRGDDWALVTDDLSTRDPVKIAGNVPHCTITTIAESPLDPNLLFVGTDDGLVQLSLDGGLSWTSLAGRFPDAPNNYWVSRVECSRASRERAYVTFTGYREDDVRPFAYATEDLGKSWRRIDGGLPREPVNVIREDPANPEVLYAGTEFGPWVSLDRGKSWSRLGDGLPTVAVHDLDAHARDREIVIATHGRGFWVADVALFRELVPADLAAPAKLLPINDLTLWNRAGGAYTSGDRTWFGANPEREVRIAYHLAEDVERGALTIEVQDARGRRVAQLEPSRKAGLHFLTWAPGGGGGGRGRGREASAPTGEFSVVLKLGELEETRRFQVRADAD